jgi:hypothetical protein
LSVAHIRRVSYAPKVALNVDQCQSAPSLARRKLISPTMQPYQAYEAVACRPKLARVAAWLNPALQFGTLRGLDLLRESLLFRRRKMARGRGPERPLPIH